jgi:hypothetical protein
MNTGILETFFQYYLKLPVQNYFEYLNIIDTFAIVICNNSSS